MRLLIAVAAAAVVIAGAAAPAATSHAGKARWTTSHASDRVSARRYVDKNAIETGVLELQQARKGLEIAKKEGDVREELRAMTIVAIGESFLDEARSGWPVIGKKCVGIGTPNRFHQYAHLRCAVLLEVAELPYEYSYSGPPNGNEPAESSERWRS